MFTAGVSIFALLLLARGAAGFSITPNGPSYVVEWTGTNAVLEHTTDLSQPFSSLDISSGLYFVTVPQPQEFFRLRLAQGSNQPPVAADDALGTPHDTPLHSFSPQLFRNDSDPSGYELTAVLFSGPTNGALSLSADGTFTYTPNAGFVGSDGFVYLAFNGFNLSGPATMRISVTNTAPASVADSYSVQPNLPLTVRAPGVLANDTDAEGDALTATLVAGPQHGSLSLYGDGGFRYSPTAAYSGTDTFTYNATDGISTGNTVAVTLHVHASDVAPVVSGNSYDVRRGRTLTVPVPGALAGATDADGDPLTASLASGPSQGTLTLHPDGSFQYTPNPGFLGNDGFTFTANDGLSNSLPATVNLNVTNHAPVAVAGNYQVLPGGTLTEPADGALTGSSDADGDSLTALLIAGPAQGTLALSLDGSFTYVSTNAGFVGDDAFTFEAHDGLAYSAPTLVTITVTNHPPVAVANIYGVHTSIAETNPAPGVLGNDTDADGDPLTAHLMISPTNGLLTLNTDGSFKYTPNPGYSGPDSFSYVANDGHADSAPAVVALNIHAVDAPPQTAEAVYSIRPGDTLIVDAAGSVLTDDTDPDSDPLTAQLVSGVSHGTLNFSSDGTFTYTPNDGFVGVDSFTYQPSDGVVSGAVTVAIINVVNSPPQTEPDQYVVHANQTLAVGAAGVLENDGDADYDNLSATLTRAPTNGVVALETDGSFTYTPNTGFVGGNVFRYAASDGYSSTEGQVAITVFNAAPVGIADQYDVVMNTTFTNPAPGVLANDEDDDGDPLIGLLASGVSHGLLAFNSDGSFIYTPANGYTGADQFTYAVTDGLATNSPIQVSLTINGPGPLKNVPLAQPQGAPQIQQISFFGGFDVLPDRKGLAPNFRKPHWVDLNGNGRFDNNVPGERAFPYIYKRGVTPVVSAKFTVPNLNSKFVLVRGKLLDNGAPLNITVGGANGVKAFASGVNQIALGNTAADGPLPNSVQSLKPLQIAWEFWDGANWKTAGTTENDVYETFGNPQSATLLTVVDASCGAAAGDNDVRIIISDVFTGVFGNQDASRSDGKPMKYYGDWDPRLHNPRGVDHLISSLDGECDTWAHYYLALLQIQGLQVGTFRGVETFGRDSVGFLVKNWNFTKAGNPLINFSTPLVLGSVYPSVGKNKNGDWVYRWRGNPDCVDHTPGVGGQNQPEPVDAFYNHCVVEIDNKLYDPSYGDTYPNDPANVAAGGLQNAAVDGYFRFMPVPGNQFAFEMFRVNQAPFAGVQMTKRWTPYDLRFTSQPAAHVALGGNAGPITVALVNRAGNTLPLNNVPITIYMANNPSGGAFVPVTRLTANGVATFANLGVNQAGSGYTLGARTPNAPNTISKLFDVP
jgi:VCBS repeat-containing protein